MCDTFLALQPEVAEHPRFARRVLDEIVGVGVSDREALITAMLPLLPLVSGVTLTAEDMKSRLRARLSGVSTTATEAFFSDVDDSDVAQILIEGR